MGEMRTETGQGERMWNQRQGREGMVGKKTRRSVTLGGWSRVRASAPLLLSSTWKCQGRGLIAQTHTSSPLAHPARDGSRGSRP